MKRGKFITLEGIDGAGKTTQRQKIAAWLRRQGLEVVETREPGGTEAAEQLREVILKGEGWYPESEVLLMFAARVQHLRDKILPALERGAFVICDRFLDSTYAYQGFGEGFPLERLDFLAKWLVAVRPDRTFWLDVPVEVGLARSQSRTASQKPKRGTRSRREPVPEGNTPTTVGEPPDDGRSENRFERKAFLELVTSGYHQLWQQEPQRIVRIDASRPLEEVWQEIETHLRQWLQSG